MNKNFFAGLFIGLGLLAIVAFKPSATLQKWEYKTLTLNGKSSTEDQLNPLGLGGWELVSKESLYCIFKRPIE